MKRAFILLTVLLLCLSGCSRQVSGKLSEINCRRAIEMMDDRQSFVLVLVSSTCDKCEEYRQVFIKLFETKPVVIYYIDTDKQQLEDLNDLVFNYLYKGSNVPSTYIIEDGKMKEMKEETIPIGELKAWFLENGIID